MTTTSTDCLACRLTGGGGLIAGGLYVFNQGRKQTIRGQAIVRGIGIVLCLLGCGRILYVKKKPQDINENIAVKLPR